ncbi:uncharacterized protein BCR38DRAFT_474488 [Pseudomassariella vexata]|uniref:Uncharacterized protein n=1 Tax=Pseudomassariella vexata TaxID=1141098 RepID=A0A1Y2DXA7_9PEZI|nr:uncharacterized protein BCR38DRAFT_474488 [Pseudomassariella vexata]ORY63911.1 hypothetical protein BCR38DRAFT_474488 [Pseudomassariella vexata]
MAKNKIWFLPPDFTFLPDGELALGTIIPSPDRPTRTLDQLTSEYHPEIPIPEIKTQVERYHAHSERSSRSFGGELFARFPSLASAEVRADVSRSTNRMFGNADHEVRTFASGFRPESLKAITALPAVKKHILSGRFGKRPVYIISGLRVARDAFTVTDDLESSMSMEIGASGMVPAGMVPVEAGGGVRWAVGRENGNSYETAPGVVFAYRLHVIRQRRDSEVESELFTHRNAFLTGDGEDDDEESGEEMEFVKVSAAQVEEDLDVDVEFEERSIGDEAYIVFKKER